MPPTSPRAYTRPGPARPFSGRAGEGGLELGLQLRVEEGERELVGLDEVDELLRLLDFGQVAGVARPARAVGCGDEAGDEVVRGFSLGELGTVDARVVELLDAVAQRVDALGEPVPVDAQGVVGPVQVALAMEEREEELAAEAVVVADPVARDREAEEPVEDDDVLDVAGEGEALGLQLRGLGERVEVAAKLLE